MAEYHYNCIYHWLNDPLIWSSAKWIHAHLPGLCFTACVQLLPVSLKKPLELNTNTSTMLNILHVTENLNFCQRRWSCLSFHCIATMWCFPSWLDSRPDLSLNATLDDWLLIRSHSCNLNRKICHFDNKTLFFHVSSSRWILESFLVRCWMCSVVEKN